MPKIKAISKRQFKSAIAHLSRKIGKEILADCLDAFDKLTPDEIAEFSKDETDGGHYPFRLSRVILCALFGTTNLVERQYSVRVLEPKVKKAKTLRLRNRA
jgi:hypothetical protein